MTRKPRLNFRMRLFRLPESLLDRLRDEAAAATVREGRYVSANEIAMRALETALTSTTRMKRTDLPEEPRA